MRHMKKFALAMLMATALAAFVGAGTASATTVEIGGVAKNESVAIKASLKAGSSILLKDTFGFNINTCTGSQVERATESPFTATVVRGANKTLTFTSCTSSVTVHNAGALYVEHIAGTTNGRVYSENADVTVWSPLHSTYVACKTGAGTLIGTTTGVKEGHATLDINATFNCGAHLTSAKWSGAYTVTTPTGFGITS